MRKALTIIGKTLLYVLSYCVLAIIIDVIVQSIIPNMPSIIIILLIVFCPVVILYFITKAIKKKRPSSSNTRSSSASVAKQTQQNTSSKNSKDKKMPNAKKCREIADGLISEAKKYISWFQNSDSIFDANLWAEQVRDTLAKAAVYEEKAGYQSYETPSLLLKTFNEEFQWKLRDAIEREEQKVIDELQGPQRNNKKACCAKLYDEIHAYEGIMSEETLDFALDAYYRICEKAGLTPQSQQELLEENNPVATTIAAVDNMNGRDFEAFCADLLRRNGFANVEVTRGSGDQGVDVLAEKDGIRYAIQCKCYTADLGNKPIQEVFAGKNIYKCQIAAVMTNRYFTQGGLEAAKATGVLLWDRRKLQEYIESAVNNY